MQERTELPLDLEIGAPAPELQKELLHGFGGGIARAEIPIRDAAETLVVRAIDRRERLLISRSRTVEQRALVVGQGVVIVALHVVLAAEGRRVYDIVIRRARPRMGKRGTG
jgi:hypothetical protein